MIENFDVAIIGGGPGGSTTGALLKKYNPDLNVVIFEREKFPRDHVGESQLPPISRILNEMGCWDKVEAANFPIKIGVTYRWGKSPELWDFEFLPKGTFQDEPRPAAYSGQRLYTAFQVDRAVYDEILLDHAESLGCEVRRETKVSKIHREGDRVTKIETQDGQLITANHYIDASGNSGIIRRVMDVEVLSPTSLKNVAVWEYWQNAEWAIEIGVGGTRVQVMSQGFGWLWFIPLGPTRTSIGLVVPAPFLKKSGKTLEELYFQAVHSDERISLLVKNATKENKLATTKDWSFLASRHHGENWWLVGESAGFADPILAAGLTMTQQAARELAFSILEISRGELDSSWIKDQFQRRQSQRINDHIRFADFWYTANAQFTDLQEFTKQLAADNGLSLTPQEAWRWLSQGGFIDDTANIGAAGFTLEQVRDLGIFLTDLETSEFAGKNNVFELNLRGATFGYRGAYNEGRVIQDECYTRDGKLLPLTGPIELIVQVLQRAKTVPAIGEHLRKVATENRNNPGFMENVMRPLGSTLEAMINDGWVTASYDPSLPLPSNPIRPSGLWKNDDPPIKA